LSTPKCTNKLIERTPKTKRLTHPETNYTRTRIKEQKVKAYSPRKGADDYRNIKVTTKFKYVNEIFNNILINTPIPIAQKPIKSNHLQMHAKW